MQRGVMFQYFHWHTPDDGSLWRELADRAVTLREAGITGVWIPPSYKGLAGSNGVGYAVYDLYDLGEFNQKDSVRTKYGTKDELLAAIAAVQAAGIHVYADVVFNHRMGGDELQEVQIEEIDWHDRNNVISDPYTIRAWSHYTFPGRGERYSALKLHWHHFTAFGCNADAPDEKKVYRVVGKHFSGETSLEYGNYDYLMGAGVDKDHPEIREDLFAWGKWFVELTDVHGFRLDAIKHISRSFMQQWLKHVREQFPDRQLLAVGEYWSGRLEELTTYHRQTEHAMHLFDVPLHYRLADASQRGTDFDLRTIFQDTFVAAEPLAAVTFVDNHDTQPGQSLESWVADWFKPHAYALILLREAGYPCIFYGDYFGHDHPDHPLTRHQTLVDLMLRVRRDLMRGQQHDHFHTPHTIAWTWTGDENHPPLAIVLNTGDTTQITLPVHQPRQTFSDLTGHITQTITSDGNHHATFPCPPRQISIWCPE